MVSILLTDAQVAELLGISRPTVWRYVHQLKDFPRPIKLSAGCTRFRRSEVEAFVDQRASEQIGGEV